MSADSYLRRTCQCPNLSQQTCVNSTEDSTLLTPLFNISFIMTFILSISLTKGHAPENAFLSAFPVITLGNVKTVILVLFRPLLAHFQRTNFGWAHAGRQHKTNGKNVPLLRPTPPLPTVGAKVLFINLKQNMIKSSHTCDVCVSSRKYRGSENTYTHTTHARKHTHTHTHTQLSLSHTC